MAAEMRVAQYGALMNPATSAIDRNVRGDLRPLLQQTFRPLQASSTPEIMWAAIPDVKANSTTVGLYNTRTLKLEKVLDLPNIQFNSMDMWVDESENKVYFVYRANC